MGMIRSPPVQGISNTFLTFSTFLGGPIHLFLRTRLATFTAEKCGQSLGCVTDDFGNAERSKGLSMVVPPGAPQNGQ